MAETTGIAWCDATFNPFIGCTKVGPGCDHCYAEALDTRHRWGGATHWGLGIPRMRTSAANWRKPLTWQKQEQARVAAENAALREKLAGGVVVPKEPTLDWLREFCRHPALDSLDGTEDIQDAVRIILNVLAAAKEAKNV